MHTHTHTPTDTHTYTHTHNLSLPCHCTTTACPLPSHLCQKCAHCFTSKMFFWTFYILVLRETGASLREVFWLPSTQKTHFAPQLPAPTPLIPPNPSGCEHRWNLWILTDGIFSTVNQCAHWKQKECQTCAISNPLFSLPLPALRTENSHHE